jgi:hypothetical protein
VQILPQHVDLTIRSSWGFHLSCGPHNQCHALEGILEVLMTAVPSHPLFQVSRTAVPCMSSVMSRLLHRTFSLSGILFLLPFSPPPASPSIPFH